MKKNIKKMVALGCAVLMGVSSFPSDIKAVTSNIHSYSITNSQLSECASQYEIALDKLFVCYGNVIAEFASHDVWIYDAEEYMRGYSSYIKDLYNKAETYWDGYEGAADKASYFTSKSISELYDRVKYDYEIIEAYKDKCEVHKNKLITAYPSSSNEISREYEFLITCMNKMRNSVASYLTSLGEIIGKLKKYESATPEPLQTKTPTTTPTENVTTTPTNITVTYAANGGTFGNGNATITKNYTKGSAQIIKSDSFPSRDGYIFDGFVCINGTIIYDAEGNFYIYMVPDNSDILTAQWKKIETSVSTQTPTVMPATETPVQTPDITQPVGTTTVPATQIPLETTTPVTAPTTEVPISTIHAQITPTPAQTTEPTAAIPVNTEQPHQTEKPNIQLELTKEKTIAVGESFKLNAKTNTTGVLTYKSSDDKVASVDSFGKVKAKKAGTVIITVSINGVEKTCTVFVKKAPTKKTFKLSATKKIIKKGKKYTIKVSLLNDSYCSKITFSSSNKKVVSVNSKGVVTAKKKGKAKIAVKASTGLKKYVQIIVK